MPPRSRLFFERLIKSAFKCCKFWVFLIESCFGSSLGSLDGVLRPGVPINPATHYFNFSQAGCQPCSQCARC